MKSLKQLEIEEDLRKRYGGMLTQENVREEMGFRSRTTVMRFLENVTPYWIHGRKKWRAADIAKHIADLEM